MADRIDGVENGDAVVAELDAEIANRFEVFKAGVLERLKLIYNNSLDLSDERIAAAQELLGFAIGAYKQQPGNDFLFRVNTLALPALHEHREKAFTVVFDYIKVAVKLDQTRPRGHYLLRRLFTHSEPIAGLYDAFPNGEDSYKIDLSLTATPEQKDWMTQYLESQGVDSVDELPGSYPELGL